MTGLELALHIGKTAGWGQKPIRKLVLVGHGTRLRPDLHENPSPGGRSFGVEHLDVAAGSASIPSVSYRAAAAGRLPSLCWFRHDAEVRLVGCNTGYAAMRSWAGILRGESVVHGTLHRVRAAMEPEGTFTAGFGSRLIELASGTGYFRVPMPQSDHVGTPAALFALSGWTSMAGAVGAQEGGRE